MGDQTPGRVGARRLVGAAGLGVLVSGLIVNVYLAVVARALPPAEYATFGSFWALALVVGFGAFLPLEQELARRLPLPGDRQRAPARRERRRRACSPGSPSWCSSGRCRSSGASLDGDVSVLLALGALCVVSAGQFLVRGTLIGTDRLVRHAAVMVLDAVVRLGLAVGVFFVGGADAAAFCWALVAAIVLAHLPAAARGVAARRGVGAAAVPGGPRRPARGARADPRRDAAAGRLGVRAAAAQRAAGAGGGQAGEAGEAAAGVFVAAFTLAKAPLSMVVPLQSAVVPTLTRLIAAGRRREVLVLLVKGVALLGAVAAVGVPAGVVVGPWVVSLDLRRRLHDRRSGPRDHPLRGARPHRARRRHPGPRRPGAPPRRRAELDRGPPGRRRDVLAVPGVILSGEVAFAGRQRGGRGGQCPDPGGVAPPSCRERNEA